MKSASAVYIFAAPSGTGKTSIAKRLIRQNDNLSACVSHTTRPPRADERHSQDYYFVSKKEFRKMVAREEFAECAEIYGNHYGSSFAAINKSLQGGDVVLEIDWRGARQIRRRFAKTFSIFILPPSLNELKRRLLLRNLDKPDVIAERLQNAVEEASHWREFDKVVVNEDLNVSCLEIERIMANQPQGNHGKWLANRTLASLQLLKAEK